MLSAWSLDVDHRRRHGHPGAHTLAARRAGRRMDAGHVQLLQRRRRCAAYRRAFDGRVVFATGCGWARSTDGRRHGYSAAQEIFSRRVERDARMGHYELSPLSASGEPVGGTSLLTATAELRFPIFKRIRGALFVEAGNVWQDPWTCGSATSLRRRDRLAIRHAVRSDSRRFRVSVATGQRTAHRWAATESRWRFNFGIGEAF